MIHLYNIILINSKEFNRMRHTYKNKKIRYATKKATRFLFYPNDPTRSFDVYVDKNPSDTIPIRYKTVDDVKDTITRLEHLYKSKKYTHKRIWQVGMIMKVRLEVLRDKKPHEYELANRYFKFLGKRTKLPQELRYTVTFFKSNKK